MPDEEIVLTKEQEEIVLANFDKMDLGSIAKLVFPNNPKASGVTKEGRAIRAFIIRNGLTVKTTERAKVPDILLDEVQKQFILSRAGRMSPYEMARSLWPEKELTVLSKEVRTVAAYVEAIDKTLLSKAEKENLDEYSEPKTVAGVIARLRKYRLADLAESKLTQQNKDNLDSLLGCFRNYRFLMTIQGYVRKEDRELFEFQYMSYSWGKEDMSESDVQTCITIASDYVTLEQAKRQKNALDVIINDVLDARAKGDEKSRIQEGMTELSDKLQNLCDTTMMRIKQMTTALEGSRHERMKLMTDKNKSILVLVEAMRHEATRIELLKMGEMEQKALNAEIEKVEKASDYIARLYGISKEELLH